VVMHRSFILLFFFFFKTSSPTIRGLDLLCFFFNFPIGVSPFRVDQSPLISFLLIMYFCKVAYFPSPSAFLFLLRTFYPPSFLFFPEPRLHALFFMLLNLFFLTLFTSAFLAILPWEVGFSNECYCQSLPPFSFLDILRCLLRGGDIFPP